MMPPEPAESQASSRHERKDARWFVDDTEEAIWEVRPEQNVYSYFMFVTPTEMSKEKGAITWDTIVAVMLVLVNFFMQGVLLHVIFSEVVVSNLDWQGDIMRVGGVDWNLFEPAPSGASCNKGTSLCFKDNRTFTCAPPSVQLTGRWEELDTDKDGVWTLEEVESSREELKCKYTADPIEMFNVFREFLLGREDKIWIHPDLRAGTGIHSAYFTYALGDIAMCGYRNQDMCSNLLQRGVFDGALKHGKAPRVGTTIKSALDFCYDLLKPGGRCERLLPSTYAVWKTESVSQCLGPSFSKFTYTHPSSGAEKSLLEVDYKARKDYAVSKTPIFLVYKCIIVTLWLLTMYEELKEITIIFTWMLRFPDAGQFKNAVTEQEHGHGQIRYTIQGITKTHRVTMAVVNSMRFIMVCVLASVGVSFLLKQTCYVSLLMDGIALVFVAEIARVLYAKVLRPQIREQCEDIESMHVPMYGINALNTRPALTEIVCVVLLFAAATALLGYYNSFVVAPLYNALECTCLSKGEHCREATRFSRGFWDDYWGSTVPAVYDDIAMLKEDASGGKLARESERAGGVPAAGAHFLLGAVNRHPRRRGRQRPDAVEPRDHQTMLNSPARGHRRQHWGGPASLDPLALLRARATMIA